jgi:hypothetical protein
MHGLRAAARTAAIPIAAAAAFGSRVAAAAAELLAKDASMTAGEVSKPVGRGGGLKQPPDRRAVACCSGLQERATGRRAARSGAACGCRRAASKRGS